MTEVNTGSRAKSAHIAVKRKNKYGKDVPARDEVIPLLGAMSGKEAEREITRVAEEQGYEVDRVRIDTYARSADAPMTTNPRRGHSTRHFAMGWSPLTDSEASGVAAELLAWPRASQDAPDQGQEN